MPEEIEKFLVERRYLIDKWIDTEKTLFLTLSTFVPALTFVARYGLQGVYLALALVIILFIVSLVLMFFVVRFGVLTNQIKEIEECITKIDKRLMYGDKPLKILGTRQKAKGVISHLREGYAIYFIAMMLFLVASCVAAYWLGNTLRGKSMVPGETTTAFGEIELNAGRPTVTLTVANTGDRPVQVGSHYHFYETNAALAFDREQARGMRLDIPAGSAVRFEPGQSREVTLVAFGGARKVYGFNQKVMGAL